MQDRHAALTALRRLILQDEAVAAALYAAEDAEQFLSGARAFARKQGLRFEADVVQELLRPDPLGLARFTAAPALETSWPPLPWLPTELVSLNGRTAVDWAYFGNAPLRAPFFADQARRARGRPINRVSGYRMMLDDVIAGIPAADCLPPNGFIFHMSRCGSTLVAQMLAASAHNVVISEAPPIDAVLHIERAQPDLSPSRRQAALAAVVGALGRRRSGSERRYFVKLDSWHILSLPVFRRVFPDTPWIFLYRDPVEVLVSQMREPGSQITPDLMDSRLYGIDPAFAVPGLDYTARVLSAICTAAADHYSADGGLLVNYRDLPNALFDEIMPHFAAHADDTERALMGKAAEFDAKTPQLNFKSDIATKQSHAKPELRAAAERHLGPVYRRLEALRTAQRQNSGAAGSAR